MPQNIRVATFTVKIILTALFFLRACITFRLAPDSELVSAPQKIVTLVLLVSAVSAIAMIPNRKLEVTDGPKLVTAAMAVGVNYYAFSLLPKANREGFIVVMAFAALLLFSGLLAIILLSPIDLSRISGGWSRIVAGPISSLWQQLKFW